MQQFFFCTFPSRCFTRLKRETSFSFPFTLLFHISGRQHFSFSNPPLYNFYVFLPTRLVSVVIYFSLLTSVTLDIGLHVVGVRTVGVRTLRHNQIFSDGQFTKFSYSWCSAGALRARELRYDVCNFQDLKENQGTGEICSL